MDKTVSRQLYRYIPIWAREGGIASLYRVIEVLDKGFIVQSKDYFDPSSGEPTALSLEKQFVELFMEVAPEQRDLLEPSIAEAITRFDRSFE